MKGQVAIGGAEAPSVTELNTLASLASADSATNSQTLNRYW